MKKDREFLLKIFYRPTHSWKIVHARTLYLTELMEELSNNFAQITMSYKTEDDNKENFIIFERDISENFCLYNWKIFLVKYPNF